MLMVPDSWKGDWLGSSIAPARGKDPITVSGSVARDIWDGASEIRLRSVPLLDFRNEKDVNDHLVIPLPELDKRV